MEPPRHLRRGEPRRTHERDATELGEDLLVPGAYRLEAGLLRLQGQLVVGDGLGVGGLLGLLTLQRGLGDVELIELAVLVDGRGARVGLPGRDVDDVLDAEHRAVAVLLLVDGRGAGPESGPQLVDLGLGRGGPGGDIGQRGLRGGHLGLHGGDLSGDHVQAGAGLRQLEGGGDDLVGAGRRGDGLGPDGRGEDHGRDGDDERRQDGGAALHRHGVSESVGRHRAVGAGPTEDSRPLRPVT